MGHGSDFASIGDTMKALTIVISLMFLVGFVPVTAQASSRLSMEDGGLAETIMGWIEDIGNAMIQMIKAPFLAIAEFFRLWGQAIIDDMAWIAPVVVTISVMGSWLVYKAFSYFQSVWFD